jgi:hypothetical protein
MLSTHGALHSVAKLDETVLKPFGRPQRQRDVTVTSAYKRNAISDKCRNDANDELVDRLRIKKGGDDFTAAHQPDISALALAKSIREHTNCLVREFDGRWSSCGTWMTREDDGSTLGIELCSHAQTRFVGLPAEHFRIDGSHECVDPVKTRWRWASGQPFEVAVRPRDVSISARRDVDDDFSLVRHEAVGTVLLHAVLT